MVMFSLRLQDEGYIWVRLHLVWMTRHTCTDDDKIGSNEIRVNIQLRVWFELLCKTPFKRACGSEDLQAAKRRPSIHRLPDGRKFCNAS